jgi:hypothetical protein
MKKTLTTLASLLIASTSQALPEVTVESIYDLPSSDATVHSFTGTVDGVSYYKSLPNDNLVFKDVSLASKTDIISAAIAHANQETPLSLLMSYPTLPNDQASLDLLVDSGFTPTQTGYDSFIDDYVNTVRFQGVRLSEAMDASFEGSDENFTVLYSDQDAAIYQCDRDTHNPTTEPRDQPTSCSILAYDISTESNAFIDAGYYKDGTMLTAKNSGLFAYTNGQEYQIPALGEYTSNYKIASTTIPFITLDNIAITSTVPENRVYRLNTDGTVSTLTVTELNTGQRATVRMNDELLLVVMEDLNTDEITSGYCTYEIIGTSVNCQSGELTPLPFNITPLSSSPYDYTGFIQYPELTSDNLIVAHYVAKAEGPVTQILYNLNDDSELALSTVRLNKLKSLLGENYVNDVRQFILSILPGIPTETDPNITPELESAFIDEFTAMTAVKAYPQYQLDGNLEDAILEMRPVTFIDYFIGTRFWQAVPGTDTIKTALAKFSIKQDVTISGLVTLPGSEVPSNGIGVVLLGDMGDRLELTTDNNGIFSILNPVSSTYELTFSYPNHVFECANVDLSSGTFGEFEMLAGDVNDDGEISSADQWIFYLRAFYPSTDFDLNNDGVVNNTDRNIISTNRGAVQCNL